MFFNNKLNIYFGLNLTISVLQACCAVTTEYSIPSNFVRKSTASLQITISTAQLNEQSDYISKRGSVSGWVGGWVGVGLTRIFFGKPSQNSPIPVLTFSSSILCVCQ